MSRVERTVSRTSTIMDISCDVCSKSINPGNSVCWCCKRDLCRACSVWDDRDHSDYPPVFCSSCWEIGRPYRMDMVTAESDFDAIVDEMETKWYDEAKASLKEVE